MRKYYQYCCWRTCFIREYSYLGTFRDDIIVSKAEWLNITKSKEIHIVFSRKMVLEKKVVHHKKMHSSLLLMLPNCIPAIDVSCYKVIESSILQERFSSVSKCWSCNAMNAKKKKHESWDKVTKKSVWETAI